MAGQFAALSIVLWCILVGQIVLVDALSNAERKAIVKIHNDLRSQLTQGKSLDGQNRPFPPAANMAKLYYDEKLESSAQAAANKCIFQHTPQPQPPKFGENIAYNTADMSIEDHLKDAAKMWWEESRTCSNLNLRMPLPKSPSCYLHFTAMAWAKTTRIGCGFKECPDAQYGSKKYVFCQYQEPGNFQLENVYEIGTPCSKCGNGKSCDRTSGLCYEKNKKNPNKPPTKTQNPMNPKKVDNAEPTKMCRCPPNNQPPRNGRRPRQQTRPNKFSKNGQNPFYNNNNNTNTNNNNNPQYPNNRRVPQRRPQYTAQQQMPYWN